jgi:hypothetical protein
MRSIVPRVLVAILVLGPGPATATIPGNGVACDFVTGGGWIPVPSTDTPESTEKGSFAVAGGIKHGAFWGHLQYNDHGTSPPIQVHGRTVTAYGPAEVPNTRVIKGTARVRGFEGVQEADYEVTVADNREPGRNYDVFSITVVNPDPNEPALYTAGGPLGGGNIQLHKGNASNTNSCPS